eukprot:519043_1
MTFKHIPLLINSDELIDIRERYSTEAANTQTDPAFLCNSFSIYSIYLTLNISLLSEEQFYLNINYECTCNGCSVNNFFESSIELQSLSVNNISLEVTNQESCIFTDNNNYSLETLNEIYFNFEYDMKMYEFVLLL